MHSKSHREPHGKESGQAEETQTCNSCQAVPPTQLAVVLDHDNQLSIALVATIRNSVQGLNQHVRVAKTIARLEGQLYELLLNSPNFRWSWRQFCNLIYEGW